MRERELKQSSRKVQHETKRSLPMRERELKHLVPALAPERPWSLPMRERELKLQPALRDTRATGVAPHAGA